MSDLDLIREKARKEGYEAGAAEGAAMVRASAILGIRAALKSNDQDAELLELLDHLGSSRGAFEYGKSSDVHALRDRLLGRVSTANLKTSAAKPGESQTAMAERVLRENGFIGADGAPKQSGGGDLGDQVVERLMANRGQSERR